MLEKNLFFHKNLRVCIHQILSEENYSLPVSLISMKGFQNVDLLVGCIRNSVETEFRRHGSPSVFLPPSIPHFVRNCLKFPGILWNSLSWNFEKFRGIFSWTEFHISLNFFTFFMYIHVQVRSCTGTYVHLHVHVCSCTCMFMYM